MSKEHEQTIPFAIVPSEVVMDTRLTLETMRVLVTLYSFRNKNTGLAFPGREAISERCGMHPSNISEATSKLVDLGWVVKDGEGGHSKSTRYTINIPEVVTELAASSKAKSQARKDKKVADSAMVAQSAIVAEQATLKVADSATPRIAQSATRKEHTNITNQLTVIPLSATPEKVKPIADTELQTACKATWKSYCAAYFNRYGVDPLRNLSVNSTIKLFVKKLPYTEAPLVAAFFVNHNDKFYIQKTHAVPLMLKDAEGLRTQWATGQTMTGTKASQIDKTASNYDSAQQAMAMLRRKNAAQ